MLLIIPLTLVFLIDTLLQWNNDSEHVFSSSIDENRIAVTGVSLGGLTSTLAAYHPEQRDPRIKLLHRLLGL